MIRDQRRGATDLFPAQKLGRIDQGPDDVLERLSAVLDLRDVLAARLDFRRGRRSGQDAEIIAIKLQQPAPRGIHRDFYPDQIIVSGSRLYLIDLDLYCLGDPALDVGNFLAHLTEMAVRGTNEGEALARCEDAVINSFMRLNPSIARGVVEAWKKLALARHVHISTQFPDRQAFTRTILEMLLRDGR